MNKTNRTAYSFVALLLLTALGSLYIGKHFLQQQAPLSNSESPNWHYILHDRLHITQEQDEKLKSLEIHYMERRQALEKQMQQANRDLAEAIKSEKTYTARIQDITENIHHIMGELQKATLEHIFEMRPILTDEQNEKLEQMVTDALTRQ